MTDYRRDFPDFGSTVYLNCAYQGVLPLRAIAAIERAVEAKRHPHALPAGEYFDLPERVRERLARLTGAEAGEIALTNSATQGIGIVATGLGLRQGDEVVVADCNFPSNLFTWLHLRRLGVIVHVVECRGSAIEPDAVAALLNSRTKVLALDWVSYSTGARIELARFGELAHRHGAIFVVDGTQGAGALEINLHALPVDVMAIATYKWFLGPYGTGCVYLSRELQSRLDLPVVNWLAVEGADDFDALPKDEFTLASSAKIFDVPETGNFLNLYPLDAALEYLEAVGVTRVTEHCRRLLDCLAEGLRNAGFTLAVDTEAAERSTILAFCAPSLEETTKLHQRLRDHQFELSLRQGNIRISPYLYNSMDEANRLLDVIKSQG
jgi:selenocysteine lyase/cysteine desulfurase